MLVNHSCFMSIFRGRFCAQRGVKQGCQEIISCFFAAGLDKCVSCTNLSDSAIEAKLQRLVSVTLQTTRLLMHYSCKWLEEAFFRNFLDIGHFSFLLTFYSLIENNYKLFFFFLIMLWAVFQLDWNVKNLNVFFLRWRFWFIHVNLTSHNIFESVPRINWVWVTSCGLFPVFNGNTLSLIPLLWADECGNL